MTRQGTPKPMVLTVLIGGGFSFEMKCLLASLADEVDFAYLATDGGGTPGQDGIPEGPCLRVPMSATVTRNSKVQTARAFAATFAGTLRMIRTHGVDAVAGIGCSHLIPMFAAARLARCRTAYLESITRADRLSVTGRIVYAGRLADTFIVQWPELARTLPRARMGSIL